MEQTPHRLGIVILPEFSNLGLALTVEPLFIANWIAQRSLFHWSVLSVDGLSVRASNGMWVPVDAPLGDPTAFDTVIVIASFDVKQHAADQRLTGWLRRVARFGVEVGAIETGSEVLAAAGLLDGHQAAIHWDNLEGFQERYPDVQATAQLYTLGRGRMTCAGASTIVDMMLHWLAQHGDQNLAEEVAQHLLISRQRPSSQEQQPSDAADATVTRALRFMQEAIEEPISCVEIAKRTGVSQRQLQRHFRQHLGMTVTQQYTQLKLAKAHKLLQQTELTVTEVAVGSGFASLEHFSRVYRKAFGCAPSSDRRQSTSAPVLRPRKPIKS